MSTGNMIKQILAQAKELKELKDLSNEYQKEVEACFDIAQRLDSLNPTLAGTFTGTPSERIKRQLASMNIQV